MKKVIVIQLALMLVLGQAYATSSQDKLTTETFKVFGNCGMCKRTIEGSLEGVKGINKFEWNQETKQMKVVFNEDVINLNQIKQLIADVGYDTDEIKAKNGKYNKLPGCCQYDRE